MILKRFYTLTANLLQLMSNISAKLLHKLKQIWGWIRFQYLVRFNPDKLEYTEEFIETMKEAMKDMKEGRLLTHEEVFGKEEINDSTN